MAGNVNLGRGSDLLRRINGVVCLVLVILFLYNPYLAVAPSSSVLNVHHSLSYRATVGSSELQHFSPTNARKILALSIASVLTWLDSPASPIVVRVNEVSPHPAYAFEVVCSDLWFRPPPAV
jgi:exosortase/archaeosortase